MSWLEITFSCRTATLPERFRVLGNSGTRTTKLTKCSRHGHEVIGWGSELQGPSCPFLRGRSDIQLQLYMQGSRERVWGRCLTLNPMQEQVWTRLQCSSHGQGAASGKSRVSIAQAYLSGRELLSWRVLTCVRIQQINLATFVEVSIV